MNNVDLPSMIRECVDGGTHPVTAGEIKARAMLPARRGPRMARGPRAAIGVTGLAAAGAVAALVVSQAGGGPAPTRTVLTAAVIGHMASTSQAAMTSGQADLDWTSSGQPSVVQQISFNGADWNDVIDPGQPTRITHTAQGIVRTGESINRVVNGQQFHYPNAVMTRNGGLEFKGWMRIDAPSAGRPLGIPDPRTLLSVLSPSAGFATDGTGTVNGVTVSRLRATTPGAVAIAPLSDIIDSEPDGARLSVIDLWVDSSDVVLKAEVTLTGTNGSGGPQSVTVTVTFSQIGQLLPITPPASYTTVGDKG
jgi:hypothetical protein